MGFVLNFKGHDEFLTPDKILNFANPSISVKRDAKAELPQGTVRPG
jgi:hypothetical protein